MRPVVRLVGRPVARPVLRRWASWDRAVLDEAFERLELMGEAHYSQRTSRGHKCRRVVREPTPAARREATRRRSAAVAFVKKRRRSERVRCQSRARGWVDKLCA